MRSGDNDRQELVKGIEFAYTVPSEQPTAVVKEVITT